MRDIEVYPVPGTNGVWAVYSNDAEPKRWVGLHVPTGLSAYNDLASREEAEDLLCWMWCNAIDQEGLYSNDNKAVTSALGARVMSRFRGGGPFKQPRRKRIQKIGQTQVEVSDDEAYYMRRLRELGAEREEWLKTTHGTRALLAEQDRLIVLRERAVEQLEKNANQAARHIREVADEYAADQRSQIEDARAQVTAARNQYEIDQQELADQQIDVDQLRTAMFQALQAVDIGAVLTDGELSLGRHLRKIRIKGVLNPELDPPESDENNSVSM